MFEYQNLNQIFIHKPDQSQLYNQGINNSLNPNNKNVFCQLCSNIKNPHKMYSVNQKCDHLFCQACLTARLEQCINKNQQMYCPIDYCPNSLSQSCQFFIKLPNSIYNRYVIWKNSSEYLNRNQSVRMSANSQFENNYFGPNHQEIKRQSINQYPQVQQLHFQQVQKAQKIDQKKEQLHIKKRGKKKNKKINKNKPDKKQDNKNQQYLQLKQVEEAEQALMHNKIPPIPYKSELIQKVPQVQVDQVPYTCKRYIVKTIYLVLGIPIMFLAMALLIANMVIIYGFVIGSHCGFLLAIVVQTYIVISCIQGVQDSQRNQYIKDAVAVLIGAILCLAFIIFFRKNLRIINHLIITNSWIWFIKKLIGIWAYPYPSPPIYLGPRIFSSQNEGMNV